MLIEVSPASTFTAVSMAVIARRAGISRLSLAYSLRVWSSDDQTLPDSQPRYHSPSAMPRIV